MNLSAAPPAPATERLNTKAAGLITLAVLCSRLLGLVREQIFAALFEAKLLDAFTAAFRIPNLLRDLFAEGALSAAFVTVFSKRIARDGDASAWSLANKVATLTAVVLGLICIAGMVFSTQLVAALASGFGPDKAALTADMTRIMFPFILLVSLAALVMGMLNAKNVFGMPAMASSFFNLGSIIGGVGLGFWIDPHFGPRAMLGVAIGTVFGGALQLLVQLPALSHIGYRFRPDFSWRDPGVKSILLLMGPAVVAASTTQVNVLVNTTFASHMGDGRMFWLNIAFRLMQLPLGLFGVALGTVTLPLLSRLVVAGEMTAVRTELARGIRLAFLLSIPSTVGLIMLAEPIMSFLYQHLKFTAYDAAQSAGALRFYAIGLTGYASLKILVNAFYALERRKTPMLVGLFAVALNLVLNWIFTVRLGWEHRGLALSTGCIASINFLILYMLMARELRGLETRRLLILVAKLALACVAMGAICWASTRWLLADWATMPVTLKGIYLFGTIAVSGLVFALISFALRIEEIRAVIAAVQRRLQRRSTR